MCAPRRLSAGPAGQPQTVANSGPARAKWAQFCRTAALLWLRVARVQMTSQLFGARNQTRSHIQPIGPQLVPHNLCSTSSGPQVLARDHSTTTIAGDCPRLCPSIWASLSGFSLLLATCQAARRCSRMGTVAGNGGVQTHGHRAELAPELSLGGKKRVRALF